MTPAFVAREVLKGQRRVTVSMQSSVITKWIHHRVMSSFQSGKFKTYGKLFVSSVSWVDFLRCIQLVQHLSQFEFPEAVFFFFLQSSAL